MMVSLILLQIQVIMNPSAKLHAILLTPTRTSSTASLTCAQNLYNLLRIISIVGVIAGVIGVLASLKPNRTRIYAATGAAGIAAVASLVLNIYGLSNDYRSFVYSLEDGSGNGQTQLIAMLVLLAVSVIAAIVAVVCGRAYTDAVNGREREKYVRPSEAVAAAQPELDADRGGRR